MKQLISTKKDPIMKLEVMVMEEKQEKSANIKKFTKQVSLSSQKILAAFFDDSLKDKEKKERICRQLDVAIRNKELVVIQLRLTNSALPEFETVAGFVYRNKNSPAQIILRSLPSQTLRMIAIKDILKVSILHQRIARA